MFKEKEEELLCQDWDDFISHDRKYSKTETKKPNIDTFLNWLEQKGPLNLRLPVRQLRNEKS